MSYGHTMIISVLGGVLGDQLVLSFTLQLSAKQNVISVIRIHLLKIAHSAPPDPSGGRSLHAGSYDLRAIKGLAQAFPCFLSWLESVDNPSLGFGLALSITK